ncbi:NfeD family protein [Allorhizocola rhizosphaerae]|uniref:NfeD family protein n=1 Tax=Allorhizocola rhizosphaerae TaxID=1872709 RepID=UPI001FEBEE4F|nr:NfeD family protein [Allorhizocola rhizosphaerae]
MDQFWIWWLVAAGALVVAELFTGTFVLLMLGAGAFAGGIVAVAGGPLWLQALVFAVVSTFALWLVRPWINKRLERGKQETGLASIEGADATVVERVEPGRHGMVKIEGELWRARPYEADKTYDPGERVRVAKVDGATVLVWRD